MIFYIPALLNLCVITCALAAIAYIDHKTQRINVFIVAAMTIICTVYTALTTTPYPFASVGLGLALGTVPFIIMAVAAKGGFGDVILMGALGICLGSYGIVWVIILSGLCYMVFGFYHVLFRSESDNRKIEMKEKLKKQYPYAPFVLAGWVIYAIVGLIQNGITGLHIPA